MNITAAVFYNYVTFAPTFQDGLLFMDQAYRSFTAIIPYCLHFFFLSTVLVISYEHDGQRLAWNLFNFNLPFSHFHIIAKVYTIFFALYYTKGLGSDEIFELLLSCQIMSVVLLIVSVIPLLQFPSFPTGFSISPLVSCLSIFSSIVIISANILFINEMIYYNSEWFIDPMENSADKYLSIYYLDVFLLSASITLTLYLCFSVLKYFNSMPYKEIKLSGLEDEQSKKHELAEKNLVEDLDNKSQNSSCDISFIKHGEKKSELTSRSIEEGNMTLKEGVLLEINGPESKVNGLETHLTSGNSLNNQYRITRADRRQLASILDEFWGLMFDYHGNLTEEAKQIGVSIIFDISDVESPVCTKSQIITQKDEVALSNGYKYEVFEHAHLTTGNMVNWTQNYLTSFPNYAREDEVVYNAVEKLTWGGKSIYTSSGTQKKQLTYGEVERLVLHSLEICIRRISSLNCSEWLFCENDGCDEKLIEHLARNAKFLNKDEGRDLDEGSIVYLPSISYCGKECIWQASLVLSFAVWSIRRMLRLVSKETRPDLWGKFTFVLNRVQGLLNLIFCKPRTILPPCKCLQAPQSNMDNCGMSKVTCKREILELIKEAEAFSLQRKGRAGTAADIAFSKGKQNLISAFRRYKRKLSN